MDGKVHFKDDGTGESAFKGHAFAEGDDWIEAYGEELNVAEAVRPENWKLYPSGGDGEAVQPLAVHRKSKVFNSDHAWNYKLDHWLFLKLPKKMENGDGFRIEVADTLGSEQEAVEFVYDLDRSQSEAVHVNLIGYTPDSPIKSADLYLWLGDGGPRDYSGCEGNEAWLFDVVSEKRFPVGKVEFWKEESDKDAGGRNLTGSPVWTVDFSDHSRPGRYRLVVDGVGASPEFEISEDIWKEPYSYSTMGYYYMRLGEAVHANNPPPRQPRFIPGEDPAGFTIYLTDFDPFDEAWKARKGDTWDEPHFKPAVESMFWERRLPGNPTNDNAIGGHSDALDWDRHLAHVSNIYDMLLPFLLSDGGLSDDDLGIAESGNGIPDLIDEARNEVDMFLSLRVGEAYAQGLTNPSKEKTVMFQAGATTMAAWANSANSAILAEAFRLAGDENLKAHYLEEAITAFRFASKQDDLQLDEKQDIGDAFMRGRDFRMMAAAFLYNVTGDREWEDLMAADSVVKDGVADIEERSREWVQTWGTAAYLLTPHKQHYPELAKNMKASVRKQALENNVRFMNERPSRRSSNNNYWRTKHELQLVAIAHHFSKRRSEKERFEKAMILEADWGLGRNPSNTVEMTGLGSRHIVNCYTSGGNDGVPGMHPGHTPYNNLDPWGTTWRGSMPQWFTERGYPEWEEGGWPEQESFFNCRYSWTNGEFTPRQTMRGKHVLYSYLYWLSKD
ncbi:glycoside hydrolase family 9 protein [Pelagicoccus mobilis]|uniref:Glycoside hydrolase family 9 protein n=2 Tax=Pelagicoccus mobilis TaxID=415221 RepID=A0A934RWA6_9BACT|nr:glycoside hydrolase family 9 protein [Pelagicoccus mobilis]MBK1877661.1 glycoside hydrolase family 9 protein [Pelagicoccus mobilis]